MREHYETYQSIPAARTTLKAMGRRIGKENATRRYLYQLFPYGYGQQACKIAGTRKPLILMLDVKSTKIRSNFFQSGSVK